jgi:hypothetical protein
VKKQGHDLMCKIVASELGQSRFDHLGWRTKAMITKAAPFYISVLTVRPPLLGFILCRITVLMTLPLVSLVTVLWLMAGCAVRIGRIIARDFFGFRRS